jgi:hypothetical protein
MSLQLHYTFEDYFKTKVYDEKRNYNGFFVSGTAGTLTSPGQHGNAVYFDGDSAYLSVTSSLAWSTTSISVWIKATHPTTSTQNPIVFCRTTATSGWSLDLEYTVTSGDPAVWIVSEEGSSATSLKTNISHSSWVHIVAVWDGSSVLL